MAETDWGRIAQHNTCFVTWLKRADMLCDRLLDIELFALVESREIDPSDSFYSDHSPERFVQDCVIPMLEQEHGAEFIYHLLSEMAMWGDIPPAREAANGS